jgi:hypothetical protein
MKLATLAAVILITIIAACARTEEVAVQTSPPPQPAAQAEEQAPPPNPPVQAPIGAVVQQPTPQQTTPADVPPPAPCSTPLSVTALQAALPANARGYDAGSPEGSELLWTDPATGEEVRYNGASVVLEIGDDSIIVAVMDTCLVPSLRDPWTASVEQETESGYLRRSNINGNPAWTNYDAGSDTYAVTILANDRVLASVQGTPGVPEADVLAVAEGLRLNSV